MSIISFESDKDGDWNKNGMLLRESYGKDRVPPIFENERRKMIAPALEFLTAKYKSGEPSAMFAAVRTWEDYLNLRNKRQASDTLTGRLHMMYKPFMVYGEYKPWDKRAAATLSVALRDDESDGELWYPIAKRPFETVAASASLLPVIFYCMNKINEWGYVFQKCKICGKDFLARSCHYELCSNECRKAQAVTAKKEHTERAKGNRVERLDVAAYDYWYNRWRKLNKGKNANPEKAAAFKVELDAFRDESKKRKAVVKSGEMPFADFTSWLAKQNDVADRLMEELTQKKRDR